MEFVYFLLIGLAAGFLAGLVLKGRGFGLVGNLIIGVLGAVVGGFLFGLLQMKSAGLIGQLFVSTVGAIVLLFLVGLATRGKK
jgi:uncharacterized membrane protein YeaQ/YmgE (transglycosylase-associated protein family)